MTLVRCPVVKTNSILYQIRHANSWHNFLQLFLQQTCIFFFKHVPVLRYGKTHFMMIDTLIKFPWNLCGPQQCILTCQPLAVLKFSFPQAVIYAARKYLVSTLRTYCKMNWEGRDERHFLYPSLHWKDFLVVCDELQISFSPFTDTLALKSGSTIW